MFLDRASIHFAEAVQDEAFLLDIPLIFNLPYRPDLMGIELLWGHAKKKFY